MKPILIEKQKDWAIIKISGQFAAVTKTEDKSIGELVIEHQGFTSIPPDKEFTAYLLEENENGRYVCKGKSLGKFKVNTLEFFLLAD